MIRVKRLLACVVLIASAACSGGGRHDPVVYVPPPPLALVAILDPSPGHLGDQLTSGNLNESRG
jgi:hypothetical protein